MKKIIIQLYNSFSPRWRRKLGGTKILSPLRNFIFRDNGKFREVEVPVKKLYGGQPVKFLFNASLQVAAKARKRGVENMLLNNSIKLLEKYKGGRDDLTILDIGSNFGYLSLVWASSVAKNGKVVAFEPNSKVANSLIKSVKENKLEKILSVEKIALGKEEGEVTLYDFNTTSNVLFMEELVETGRSEHVMSTIDKYVIQQRLVKIDLLKIDVDGTELDVLEGGAVVIQRDRPIIIVEVNAKRSIFDFLEKNNYLIFNMKLERIDKHVFNLPPNVFCIPQ